MLGSTNRASAETQTHACLFHIVCGCLPLYEGRVEWAVAESMSQSLNAIWFFPEKSLLIPGLICNTGVSKMFGSAQHLRATTHTVETARCSWAV